jgi:hypothetical protein
MSIGLLTRGFKDPFAACGNPLARYEAVGEGVGEGGVADDAESAGEQASFAVKRKLEAQVLCKEGAYV